MQCVVFQWALDWALVQWWSQIAALYALAAAAAVAVHPSLVAKSLPWPDIDGCVWGQVGVWADRLGFSAGCQPWYITPASACATSPSWHNHSNHCPESRVPSREVTANRANIFFFFLRTLATFQILLSLLIIYSQKTVTGINRNKELF